MTDTFRKFIGYEPQSERGTYHDKLEVLLKFPIELGIGRSCSPNILQNSLSNFYTSLKERQIEILANEKTRPQYFYIACPPVLVSGATHLLTFEFKNSGLYLVYNGVYRTLDSYPTSQLRMTSHKLPNLIGLEQALSPSWQDQLIKDVWAKIYRVADLGEVQRECGKKVTKALASFYYAVRNPTIPEITRGSNLDIQEQISLLEPKFSLTDQGLLICGNTQTTSRIIANELAGSRSFSYPIRSREMVEMRSNP